LGRAAMVNRSKRLRHEAALVMFGELALRSDDLDEILTEACRLVGEALGTDLAKVIELQADGETLLVRAGVGWMPGVVGVVALKAADDTSEGHALKTGVNAGEKMHRRAGVKMHQGRRVCRRG